MKSLVAVGAGALLAGLAGTGLCATAGEWVYRTDVGTSADAPTLWTDVENWKDGNVPNGAADTATFGAAATGNIFIEAPATLAAKSINSTSSKQTLYIIGGTFVMGDASTEGTFKTNYQYPFRIFGTINYVKGTASGQYGHFAGPILPLDEFVGSSGESYQRLDWGAFGAPGVEEVDLGTFKKITLGSGGLHVYGPGWSDGTTTSGWKVRNGSRYVVKDGAKATTTYVPGQLVSGDCLAAGSSVKYIINSTTMYLDKPAETDSDNATLTFAAFHPHVVQHVTLVHHNGADNTTGVHALAESSKGHETYRMEIDEVTTAQKIGLYGADGGTADSLCAKSGTIVLKKTSGLTWPAYLKNTHFEFQAAPDGKPGIWNSKAIIMHNTSPNARFTVVEGVDAQVNSLTNLIGTYTKDGPGSLATTAWPFETAKLNAHAGRWTFGGKTDEMSATASSLTVSNGAVFAVAPGLTLTVKAGTVFAGGTLEIAEGAVVRMAPGVLQAGATVKGPGRIVFDGNVTGFPSGVMFRAQAHVSCTDMAETPLTDAPTPAVVGTPALWMDASKLDSFTYAEDGNLAKLHRWDDWRGADYNFATNIASVYPSVVTNADGTGRYVQIERIWKYDHEYLQGLVWAKPLVGIRAVFVMIHAGLGGGTILGRSSRFPGANATDTAHHQILGNHGGAFSREGYGVDWTKPLVNPTEAAGCVRAGAFYVNGREVVGTVDSLADNGYQLVESHPTAPGATADAFGIWYDNHNSGGDGSNGANRYCEVLVYTNELSYAERAQVAEYLMRKWMNRGADTESMLPSANRLDGQSLDLADGAVLELDEGDAVGVRSLSGDLTVSGGAVAVDDASDASAVVDIRGGTLTIRSLTPTADDLPSAGRYMHFDMTATNSYVTSTVNGTNRVQIVKDCDGGEIKLQAGSATTSLHCPWVSESADGLPVWDFGPRNEVDGSAYNPPFKRFATFRDKNGTAVSGKNGTLPGFKSVFLIVGNQNGGNNILSGYENNHPSRGWYRGNHMAGCDGTPGNRSYEATAPILLESNSFLGGTYGEGTKVAKKKRLFRIDGTGVNPFTEAMSDTDHQLVSYVSDTFATLVDTICAQGYLNIAGGLSYGEMLFYTNVLSTVERDRVEAYLAGKWFGRETPGCRPAVLGTLALADDATVVVKGNAPLTVSKLVPGGSVEGAIAFADGTEIAVTVENGAVSGVTVTGAVDFSAGGTVIVHGNPKELAAGAYPLVTAAGVDFGEGTWTLDVETPHRSRILTLRKAATGLVLDVAKPGVLLIVR